MLLGEPSRTAYDLNFTLFGIPVRVHPFFWLAGMILGPRSGGPDVIILWILAFFIGILCHELGHALVMRRRGDLPWITLYGFGGLASSARSPGFGRGNSEAWQQIIISAAGPFAGFFLAAIVAIGLRLADYPIRIVFGAPFGVMLYTTDIFNMAKHPHAITFINDLFFVTVAYGILNLLPVYPLDGGRIAREALVMLLGQEGVRQSLILSMFVATTLALAGGLLWQDMFFAFFFGYFAYCSFAILQSYGGRGPW